MNREVLLGKLETCIPNNDTKTFIDSIFDFTDADIIPLTDDEANRIFSISKQINIENGNRIYKYLERKGVYCLNNANSGVDELNNALLGKFYFGLYINLINRCDEKLALALLNKGVACSILSNLGVNTQANLEISIELYKSAQEIFSHDSTYYATALMNEATARQTFAEMGVKAQKNLKIAIRLYKKVQNIFPKDSTYYAGALMNEATTRQTLAERGVQTQENLDSAIRLYKEAQNIFQKNSTEYASALMNEATARQTLPERGEQTQENLNIAVVLYKKAQNIFPKNSTSYARALMNEATARQRLADRGRETQENLNSAVKLYKKAQNIFPKNSTDYARVLMNEAAARQRLAYRGVQTQENLENAFLLNKNSISILEKSNDGGTYSIVLLNLNRLFIHNFQKTGDRKYLEEAKNILEDARTNIKDLDLSDKELIQANLHEIRAILLEFEGKSGMERAAREYNEAYKLTKYPYYNFMDEFSRARIDIDKRAFCKLIENWKEIKKDGIFLDYYDYSVYECHLEKAVNSNGIKREDEFRLARKKLEEIRDRTHIKIIKDRVSAYVFLMNALVDSFKKENYDDAKENIRQACRIFDEHNDKDGSKTCELFSDAVIKKKDPEAWRKILLEKDSLSCNIFRLLSEGADSKERKTRLGTLHEDLREIKDKIDDISIKIDELKTDLNTGFERIKEKVEQGFEGENEQSQNIINRLDDTQLKLEKLADISKRSKGNEGESIRQFSKQILLLLEKGDSEALERFVKEVINNEDSLITEINDSAMPDKEKTKAKGTIKKFKKISGKAKKEAGLFGRNVSYNLAAALLAEEIIKHIFPLISTATIGVPIPSQLLELLSKAVQKK